MTKQRVYELAKELNKSSKELIKILQDYDISVKSHMSCLDAHQVEWVKKKILGKEEKEDKISREKLPIKTDEGKKGKMKTKPAEEKKEKIHSHSPRKKEDKKEHESRVKEKKKSMKKASASSDDIKKTKADKDTIYISDTISVDMLAKKIGVKATEVIKKLMDFGIIATINQEIDADTAAIIGEEFGVEVKIEKEDTSQKSKISLDTTDIKSENLKERPPVVTVMGHVDHGKTTLLDAIRNTKVTEQEAGGITQHIGAYQVDVGGKLITFIDTPGHEAFTTMRARGAQATDIAVLVVAADDGVMPQTVEAINHAKAADIPIIVAINKIDKPNAAPDRVKQQLTEYGLIPEEWGGQTVFVEISALKGQGIDQLLEMILLVAELEELKADPTAPATGIVIESQLDKGRGPVATVIVQNGTLRVGDSVFVGTTYGRVRSMMNDKGQRLREAGPSTPVQIQGFSEVPQAGEKFYVVDEKTAKLLSEQKKEEQREKKLQQARISIDDLFKKLDKGEKKKLEIVLKADVQGSLEALKNAIEKIKNEEVEIKIIHSGVGAVNETDIMLATASNALVVGFNVTLDTNAKKTAENEGVEIRLYRIIYEAIEDLTSLINGMLEPEYREKYLGRAEVRATFKVPKVGTIAGSYVIDGKIRNKSKVRIIRDGVVIYEGNIASLKRFKDDVREVEQGYECGIGIENFNDIKVGDILEAYIIEEVSRQ
ncbi:MAG: Translation initiation factor IF-2 [Clostridia bacterium 41_269]|nr:MAG: Translation initiation factor IF-2 [Clostridia bacterium 41_269]